MKWLTGCARTSFSSGVIRPNILDDEQLSCLRGEDSIAERCRQEGIAESLYNSGSKTFLDAGKK